LCTAAPQVKVYSVPAASMDNYLLDLSENQILETKPQFINFLDTMEPFESSLMRTLQNLFNPIFKFADSKMESFLLCECKVQDSIIGFQKLCFFLYGGITNSFCDRILLLPPGKLSNRWKIQKCLIDSENDGDLGLNMELLEIELIQKDDTIPFNGFQILYKVT
jgi:hypothetical protein